jgi:hypothetical protein
MSACALLEPCSLSPGVKAHGEGQEATRGASEMRRALWWAGMGLRLLVVGTIMLMAVAVTGTGVVARWSSGKVWKKVSL